VQKAFIEEQFPVSLISKESYKERKANLGQTLTGLGKWWGRKPLILVRAVIIGLLMPASNEPKKDREIFLKILTMDADGLWQRCKGVTAKSVYEWSSDAEKEKYFNVSGKSVRWNNQNQKEERDRLTRKYFDSLSYDEKLNYCDRPEQVGEPSKEAWTEINAHLKTSANSISDVVKELGEKRFGHVPKVGDAFCGGGSIPFEAARIGCEAYGSDLNPVAALLTWASLNIVGGSEETQNKIKEAQEKAFIEVDKQIAEWGIEHNDKGWRADAYLYCVEAKSPATGYLVPLAPSWVIAEKNKTVAVLIPDHDNKRYKFEIVENADKETYAKAKEGTVKKGRLICPETGDDFAISEIRGDRRVDGKTIYGLRLWENDDLVPRPNDIFQERLYCVRWVETYTDEQDQEKNRKHFSSVTEADLERERKVLSLLEQRFEGWQEKGFIPSKTIEHGDETTRLFRERGWTHWHHLFNPRQLLWHGALLEAIERVIKRESSHYKTTLLANLLCVGSCCNWNSKLCTWNVSQKVSAFGKSEQTFANQALNTQYNYPIRTGELMRSSFVKEFVTATVSNDKFIASTYDARSSFNFTNDLWITDPPYADAVNYHELSGFFLAWYKRFLSSVFPECYPDSRKALAVSGSGEDFKKSMVEIYSNLSQHMPDNGMQVVMFTHQDPSVWADLGMILWAAGLQVSAAWTIATETSSGLKKGNYVQGTVLLVLRKRLNDDVAFLDEIYPLIEDEVREQLDKMLAIDDKDAPNFGDTDYQLAAYAAALRVLTQYGEIEGMDIKHELFRDRQKSEKSEFEKVIDRAVEIACNHLVPEDFSEFYWKSLTADERLYLKGVELEKHGEFRNGAYQELAKGFGVRDYNFLYAKTKSNEARFKTASEFKRSHLKSEGFDQSLVRHLLFAVFETASKETVQEGLSYLKVEVPDYWNTRKRSLEILRYLSRLEHIPHLPHWQKDAEAARVLAGAVENDHG
jgi:adenine-specific DNA methylase